MNFKIYASIFVGLIVTSIVLFIFDPAFTRTIKFDIHEVQYKWRLFDNEFCNLQTGGHCHTNYTNQFNAKVELYTKVIATYKDQEEIGIQLIKVIIQNPRLFQTFEELTNSKEIQIDSLVKYKDEIFKSILLK